MKRSRKKSILFLGEGADDEMFLRCIKNNFGSINKNVKIIDGHGGSPISIVEDLIKNELFDHKGSQYILMDSDRSKEELDLAKKKNKRVLINQVCSIFKKMFRGRIIEDTNS